MFNYLFPIFCFGLVITGIVFLGIMEAAQQVKAETSEERERNTPMEKNNLVQSRNGDKTRFLVPTINE